MDGFDDELALMPDRPSVATPPGDAAPARTVPVDRHRRRRGDRAVTALLIVQALTLFVVIPLGVHHAYNRVLLDSSHLVFAAVAATHLVRRRALRGLVLAALVALVATPFVLEPYRTAGGAGEALTTSAISCIAFGFNALITIMVALHVFGPGRVTSHRIQGAILVYLNVAALFSIAYGFVTSLDPGAIQTSSGGMLAATIPGRVATLTYFSLTTITTTGFGDLVPVHTVARSLANLESVFGHLFPATMLARLVALNVTHARRGV